MKILLTLTTVLITNLCLIQAQNTVRKVDSFVDKPIVKMTLNGKNIWMLLDTGSSINLLNVSAASKYGFKTYRVHNMPNNVIGFASEELELDYAGNVDLRYKGIQLNSNFLAHDISNIASSFRRESGIVISGIIGSQLMRKYGFVIDMSNRTVKVQYKERKTRGSNRTKSISKAADEVTDQK